MERSARVPQTSCVSAPLIPFTSCLSQRRECLGGLTWVKVCPAQNLQTCLTMTWVNNIHRQPRCFPATLDAISSGQGTKRLKGL